MDADLRVASTSACAYLSWPAHNWAPLGPGPSVLEYLELHKMQY